MKKWHARINTAEDNHKAHWIKIGIVEISDIDGKRYDLIASNGDDVSCGGRMSKQQAIDSISAIWPLHIWETEYI